jgi:hypothetical protein
MPVTRQAGESLANRLARAPELTDPQLLDVVGQIGFALQSLHDQGRAHGHVTADAITLHDDGSVTLQSPDPAAIATPAEMAEDLAALGRMARELLPADSDPATRGFLDRLAGARGSSADAGDIARTALALAAGGMPAATTRTAAPSPPPTAAAPADPEQRRVRNRFIAVGAVVVLVGLVLLKACGGGGQAVPDVTGDTYRGANSTLHAHGFVARERTAPVKAGQRVGTVVAEFPAAGSRPRAGSTITVTVAR